uniref:shikimate kinase n=1 Tax=Eubacterium sp. TaxID=142586 RepID=UPI0040253498
MKTAKISEENIILIGMPGSGKSTCGVLAAKLLLKNFFDTDLLIQSLENKRLQQIIDERGTAEFKKAEEAAILSLNIKGTVIATGGSVVYSQKAMEHLKKMGVVIYLHLSYEEMKSRIKNLSTRGIALEKGETLIDMYNERLPLYEKYADAVIECDKSTVDSTVKKIVEAVQKITLE